MEIKKGDVVHIKTFRGVIQQEVLSCGKKYITTKSFKFNANTLRCVNGSGSGSYIIPDIEEYERKQEKHKLAMEIHRFEWDKLSLEDTITVRAIIDRYR